MKKEIEKIWNRSVTIAKWTFFIGCLLLLLISSLLPQPTPTPPPAKEEASVDFDRMFQELEESHEDAQRLKNDPDHFSNFE